MSTKHPHVPDLGYRNGVGGIGAPADYMTAAEAVDNATSRIIAAQAAMIARLHEEVRELRRELGKP